MVFILRILQAEQTYSCLKQVSLELPKAVSMTAKNIGIRNVFSSTNDCQVPREVLKTEAEGRGLFLQLPRDLANDNVFEINV